MPVGGGFLVDGCHGIAPFREGDCQRNRASGRPLAACCPDADDAGPPGQASGTGASGVLDGFAQPGGELGFHRCCEVDDGAGRGLQPAGVGLVVGGFAEQVTGVGGGAVDVVLFACATGAGGATAAIGRRCRAGSRPARRPRGRRRCRPGLPARWRRPARPRRATARRPARRSGDESSAVSRSAVRAATNPRPLSAAASHSGVPWPASRLSAAVRSAWSRRPGPRVRGRGRLHRARRARCRRPPSCRATTWASAKCWAARSGSPSCRAMWPMSART